MEEHVPDSVRGCPWPDAFWWLQAAETSVDKEGQQGAQLRPLAISLICGMAHSTQRTRAELWAHNGLELLLNLLQEQVSFLTCLFRSTAGLQMSIGCIVQASIGTC